MGAETAGRKLGIGLRLAAKAVQHHAAQATAPSNASQPPGRPAPSSRVTAYPPLIDAATRSQVTAQAKSKARGVAQGAKRFGAALFGPIAHTGGVLWLEITGLFFALFAAFFGQNAYKLRHDYAGGPEHSHFLVFAALTLVFGYFTFSSFYKARQKEKKRRARQAAR